jgi:threonine dehydratase
MSHERDEEPGPEAIRRARTRIAPFAHRTPVVTSATVDAAAGAAVFFKCENFQRVGAFKFRGAVNAVFSLTDGEAARGVATHSSGNHAQALALAARLRGIPARVVMPRTSAAPKKAAVAGYGAGIVECDPTLAAREATLEAVLGRSGAVPIHPYDDFRIIAGQATAALELLEDVPGLDLVLVPVGGGGLLAGTALAAHHFAPGTRVIAAEPAGADDAARSLAAGRIIPSESPRTIADGLLTSLGQRNFPVIRRHVERIVTVSEEGIVRAMRMIWERMKLVVEPSSAVPLAALLEHDLGHGGRKVGIVLSGGNVDLDRLPW